MDMKALETEIAVDGFISTLNSLLEAGKLNEHGEVVEGMEDFTSAINSIVAVAKMTYMFKVNIAALGFDLPDEN